MKNEILVIIILFRCLKEMEHILFYFLKCFFKIANFVYSIPFLKDFQFLVSFLEVTFIDQPDQAFI
jgi:hypothetical protein